MKWDINNLYKNAKGVSASRRTDIPAFYSEWFYNRLQKGYVEYIPPGPRRKVKRDLNPENITHFNFWSKWPKPFMKSLYKVLDIGYPVVWNISLTGLNGTKVEPNVPSVKKVVLSIKEISKIIKPEAIMWRYDPIFMSETFNNKYHINTFQKIAENLTGYVDRVCSSFLSLYTRQVKPDLNSYCKTASDTLIDVSIEQKVDLIGNLINISNKLGIQFTLCCQPEVREIVGCLPAGCNDYSWVKRVYPVLNKHIKDLKCKPCRTDCLCSEEFDIGVYDTCIFGCRYSYGSYNYLKAKTNHSKHDPDASCIIP